MDCEELIRLTGSLQLPYWHSRHATHTCSSAAHADQNSDSLDARDETQEQRQANCVSSWRDEGHDGGSDAVRAYVILSAILTNTRP